MELGLALFTFGLLVFAASWTVAFPRRGTPLRLVLTAVVVAGALGASLLVPPDRILLRFVMAILGLAALMRGVDLLRDKRRWSVAQRLWLFAAVVDIREIEPMPRSFRPRRWAIIAAYCGLGALGWWIAHAIDPGPSTTSGLLRWAGGLVMIYGLADAVCAAVVEVYALLGLRLPIQHRTPILATSLGAFWSRHYNLNVSAWLGRHFHRPLTRAGSPRLGLAVAFGASTVIHVWLAWVPLSLPMALSMGAFFVVQGIGVLLERASATPRRAPTLLWRAWTLAWLLVPSPLFVEPFLRILEG